MPEDNIAEERYWSLVSLKLAGEASPAELTELDELLRSYPEWELRMQLFTNIWNSRKVPASDVGDAFNRHLQRLSNHLATPVLQYEQASAEGMVAAGGAMGGGSIGSEPSRRAGRGARFRLWGGIAASLLCLAVLGYLYSVRRASRSGGGLNTVSTRPGSRTRIQLPDGTEVWLNADSRMSYQVGGPGPNREVKLIGEAYFDVAKDKDHPFLIHTPTIDIRVLGTTFDVRSYGNERNTEASLFKGSVEVMLRSNPDKKIVLQPNEKLIVHNDEMTVAGMKTKKQTDDDSDEPLMTLGKVHFQQKDSSYIEMLWTKNQLAFDNRTLEDVALQIERWYGVKVTVTDEQLKTVRFSGVFEDESLRQLMEALRLSGNFNYTIRKNEVIISP